MKKTRLGATNLEASEVGFGGIPIMSLSMSDAVAVIRHCFDLGITFFDTANRYATSEEKLGSALKPFRDEVIIATKTNQRDAAGAAEHIDTSLSRLQTDRIDLYQLHNLSNKDALARVLAPQGAYEAVLKARAAGKIRCIGFSSHSIGVALEAVKTGLFQAVQFPFNFIESDPLEQLFPEASRRDMGIIAMKPLGGGRLERADLCFKFLQQHPQILPIPGVRESAEADQIVGLYRDPEPLSQQDLKEIERIRSDLGAKFCHRCEYCLPCEQGVEIPRVLMFQSAAKRLSRRGVVALIGSAMETVDRCIECGECEQKCPYDLPVGSMLKENLSLYKQFTRS